MPWGHRSFPFSFQPAAVFFSLPAGDEATGAGSVQGWTPGDLAGSSTSVSPNTSWVSSVPLPSSSPLGSSFFLMTLWALWEGRACVLPNLPVAVLD